ncbi:glycosyltransferase family 87 protein [Erythrobacter sp. SG61-1L]|uniref:glycosyltransferase family 87 protein n=1 Tax=Erythrobacter sp. SG61-1L TaxID=1603897 RepID=UPI0006C92309|nr:glycosyltransferase family 87 protein [Erythrobacter sp. SG61-1L]
MSEAEAGGGRRFWPLLPEILLALAVLASLGMTAAFFLHHGYLPQPFVLDTNDTFMDWFNTAYWANNRGIYDVWRSIYPPLSFAFLDSFSLHSCYLQSPFYARDCDRLGRATLIGFYLLDVVLIWLSLRRIDRVTAPWRTIALGLGLPLLFTLERGNLILACFAFFVLAHGPLLQSRLWRGLAAAVTINFKPYLVLPVLELAVRRRWRMLELAGIATIALFLVTLAVVGSGTPGEIASNTANWIVFQSGQVWNEVNYSTSYAPFLTMRQAQVPLLDFVPSRTIETIEFAVPLAIRLTQVMALAALVAAWLQPRALPASRIAALLLGAYLVTQSPGGYTQLFLLFLVFMEPMKRPGPSLAILCAYLLCLVGDVMLAPVLQITSTSWLGERTVDPQFGLTYGHFARPGLIILIVWALSLDAIAQVARAHGASRPSLGLAAA